MSLLSSGVFERNRELTDEVAKADVVRENHLGQQVMVVAKGDHIPKGLAASDDEVDLRTRKTAKG